MVSSSAPTPRSGVYYFSQGWKLIGLPGIRRYVFLPLLVNVLLMGAAFWWLFTRLGSWIPSLMSHVPDWLQWLNYLLWPVVVLSILLVFGYFFSTIANWIAAPFSGLAGGTAGSAPDRRYPAGRRRLWHHERYSADYEA